MLKDVMVGLVFCMCGEETEEGTRGGRREDSWVELRGKNGGPEVKQAIR